jgi:octaprenyl-diphosphate synthase
MNAFDLRMERHLLALKDRIFQMERILLDELKDSPDVVATASRHITDAGGKRLRPLLLLLTADLLNYHRKDRLVFSAVVEALHTATLVHDDVIDEAVLRRGKLTLHQQIGNRMAILVGDYLYAQAVRLAVASGNVPIIQTLAEATVRLTEGEIWALDRAHDPTLTLDEYLTHISKKTGFLFAAAASIPAHLAGQPRHFRRLHAFGMNFGIFFQIMDDIQDYAALEEEAGKPVLHDLEEGKITLPVILLLRKLKGRDRRDLVGLIRESGRHKHEIARLVASHNALTESVRMAKAYAQKARRSLAAFPDSESKRLLLALPDRLLSLPAFQRL